MSNTLPTIKEIAKQLKVSTSTVSRALSNNPRIGLGTREKVQKLAMELGYEPNSQAIFFKQKKSNIIGVIVPKIREEFFSQAISGIEAIAMEKDYTILFGQSFDHPVREAKVVEAMCRQRVDGLLVSLSKDTKNYKHFEKLQKLNIPVVYFDRVPTIENAHKVYCNLYKGTLEMMDWLLKRNHRKIGFINGPSTLTASKERLKGYMDAISKHQLKINMQLVEETDFSKEGTQAAIDRLFTLKNVPTAIITFNDYVHMDAVRYTRQQNIDVNNSVIFLSYANLPITSYTAFPPSVSIEQFPEEQGKMAMQVLMDIVRKNALGEMLPNECIVHEIPGSLIVHDTLNLS